MEPVLVALVPLMDVQQIVPVDVMERVALIVPVQQDVPVELMAAMMAVLLGTHGMVLLLTIQLAWEILFFGLQLDNTP